MKSVIPCLFYNDKSGTGNYFRNSGRSTCCTQAKKMITALSIAQIVAAVDASKKSFDKSMDGMHACNETAQSLQHTPQ
jgi:hypothetical protein